jgi:ribosome-associated protein
MIAAAHIAPRKRKATRPTKAARAERTDKKRQRGAVKQTRGKVTFD